MSYYVIGIGGTGAKCIEALAHLCAAGLMPAGELYALFVDPDKSNGTLGRAEITLNQYIKCQEIVLDEIEKDKPIDLFRTKITISNPDVWSPLGVTENPTLEKYFGYPEMKLGDEYVANLFDVLFGVSEKTTNLNKGFRGHPSIGAAIMGKSVALESKEPWITFLDRIRTEAGIREKAKIILIGSIFGGTGASGVPTIAKLVRNKLQELDISDVKLGAVLMLPYFSFNPVRTDEIRADSSKFLLSTQAALQYYHNQKYLDDYFDTAYLLGEDNPSHINNSSLGGQDQINEPHFIELMSALACIDFFENEGAGSKLWLLARNDQKNVKWQDFPCSKGTEVLKNRIGQMTRCAFSFLSAFLSTLEEIKKTKKDHQIPWYINLFKREKVDLTDTALEKLRNVEEYFRSFLIWLAHIQNPNVGENLSVELVRSAAFTTKESSAGKMIITLMNQSEFNTDKFGNLVLPEEEASSRVLSLLWRRMCDARAGAKAEGIGKFLSVLYRECEH